MIGSGGASRGCTRRGISVNFIRGTSKICSKYLSQLMYSLSLGSCSLLVCGRRGQGEGGEGGGETEKVEGGEEREEEETES